MTHSAIPTPLGQDKLATIKSAMNVRLLRVPTTTSPTVCNFITSWIDLIDTGEAMLRAGLRADYGIEGEEQAYIAWRRREREERDRNLENLLAALSQSEKRS